MRIIIRLPTEELEFAERYTRAHRLSVAELIDRQSRSLQSNAGAIHLEVARMVGVIRAGASPHIGDVFLQRERFYQASASLLSRVFQGEAVDCPVRALRSAMVSV